MSVSAATAAKRRRAGNIVSTPLFKPTSAPLENTVQRRTNMPQPGARQQIPPQQQPQQRTPMPETVDSQPNMQRPMSLQQVISVFDKRLLHIEGHIIKNGYANNQTEKVDSSSITKDMDSLKESIRANLDGQFSEFDHRYQLLANEISNLKQIVLKLQSYSLEINKSLMDERNEILSKLNNVQEKVEETIDASTNTQEENLIFDVSSSDVKQEFIENACDDMDENIVEKQSDEPKDEENIMKELVDQVIEQNSEPKEEEVIEEQVAEPKEEEVIEEQVAEPKEEEEVIEEQVSDQENSKQRKKRKNKNVVAVSV